MKKIASLFIISCLLISTNLSPLLAKEVTNEIYAIVNQDPITKQEFNEKMELKKLRLRSIGAPIPPQKQLYQETLDELINESLQLQLAANNNIVISNIELNEAVQNIARINSMSYDQLKANIIASGQTFRSFLSKTKIDMTIARIQQQAINPFKITDAQINEYIRTHGDRNKSREYKIEDVIIATPDDATNQQVITAKAIADTILKQAKQKALREVVDNINQAEFPITIKTLDYQSPAQMPTLFAEVVIELKENQLSQPVETPNGFHILRVIDSRETQPTDFITKYDASHILIKNDNLDGTTKNAKVKINSIIDRIKAGEKFNDVAKTESHDNKTSSKGGKLGWISEYELPPEIAKIIKDLPLNQLSNPIKTELGWHVILVTAMKKEDKAKEVQKQKAYEAIFQEEMNKKVKDWLSGIRASSYIKILKKS